MAALATTVDPRLIRHCGGDIWYGRRPITKTEALDFLDIWRTVRADTFDASDWPAWEVAKALHGAMLRAVLDADAWARASGAERFANAAMSVLGGRA